MLNLDKINENSSGDELAILAEYYNLETEFDLAIKYFKLGIKKESNLAILGLYSLLFRRKMNLTDYFDDLEVVEDAYAEGNVKACDGDVVYQYFISIYITIKETDNDMASGFIEYSARAGFEYSKLAYGLHCLKSNQNEVQKLGKKLLEDCLEAKLSIAALVLNEYYTCRQNYKKAEFILKQVDSKIAKHALGEMYLNTGRANEALKIFESNNDYHYSCAALGDYYLSIKQKKLAKKYYLLAIEKGSTDCFENLANLFIPDDLDKAFYYFAQDKTLPVGQGYYAVYAYYFDKNQVAEGEPYFQKALELENPHALTEMAERCFYGLVDEADQEKGFDYALKASKQDFMIAFTLLSKFCVAQNKIDEAIEWLNKPLEQNNPLAQLQLGEIYYYNRKDQKLGLEYIKKAYESGFFPAYTSLGIIYLQDLKRPEKGLELLRTAVKNDEPGACDFFAEYYLNKRDYKNAYKYASVYPFNIKSCFVLGYLYFHGYFVEEDFVKAETFLSKCNDNSKAILLIGIMYYLIEEYETAYPYFMEALEKKEYESLYYLSLYYELGLDVEKDVEKAILMQLEGADHGISSCMLKVGYRYKHGLGLKVNEKLSKELYLKAVNPENPRPYIYLAEHFLDDFKICLSYINKAKRLDFSDAELLSELASKIDKQNPLDLELFSLAVKRCVLVNFTGQDFDLTYSQEIMELSSKLDPTLETKNFYFYKTFAYFYVHVFYTVLAEAYLEGKGVMANHEIGIKYLEKAAYSGDISVTETLIEYYTDLDDEPKITEFEELRATLLDNKD